MEDYPLVANTYTECKALTDDDIKAYFKFKQIKGEGAFGKVYSAVPTDLALQEIGSDLPSLVAIKQVVVRRDVKSQFIKVYRSTMTSELLNLQRLKTASLDSAVDFYGCFGGRDSLYIIMGLAAGRQLEAILDDDYQGYMILSADERLSILRELAKAITEFHSKGFVHRDLKPENVFVDLVRRPGQASKVTLKILDYGYVCSTEGLSTKDDNCRALRGTPEFLDPQALVPKGNWDLMVAADWWAFGQIAFQTFTGFTATTEVAGSRIKSLHIGKVVSRIGNFYKPDANKLIKRHHVPETIAIMLANLLDPEAPIEARPSPEEIRQIIGVPDETARSTQASDDKLSARKQSVRQSPILAAIAQEQQW